MSMPSKSDEASSATSRSGSDVAALCNADLTRGSPCPRSPSSASACIRIEGLLSWRATASSGAQGLAPLRQALHLPQRCGLARSCRRIEQDVAVIAEEPAQPLLKGKVLEGDGDLFRGRRQGGERPPALSLDRLQGRLQGDRFEPHRQAL